MTRLVHDLLGASRQQAALRAAIVVASVVYAVCLVAAGDTLPLALVVLSLLGVLCVLNPHTQLPGALILYMLLAWAAGVPTVWHPLALPAGLSLGVIHLASALAAGVPPRASLPRRLWRLYLPRLLAVTLSTTMVWGLAGLATLGAVPGGVAAAVTGVGVLAVGVVTHYLAVTRPAARAETGTPRRGALADQRPSGRGPIGFGMP